jgi:hypothetical protein
MIAKDLKTDSVSIGLIKNEEKTIYIDFLFLLMM